MNLTFAFESKIERSARSARSRTQKYGEDAPELISRLANTWLVPNAIGAFMQYASLVITRIHTAGSWAKSTVQSRALPDLEVCDA